MKAEFKNTLEFARQNDEKDPLKNFRNQFYFPQFEGKNSIYLAGNSLGLQPKKAKEYVNQELNDWAQFGVEGHFHAKNPWLFYHENLTEQTARLVGAKPLEVVVMNTLTVNLHLMMISFYRPTAKRFKIIMEAGAFPSDQYAIDSQVRFHGYDSKSAVIEIAPRKGETFLRTEDILERIEKDGDEVALVLFGNVNYLTGQAFDIADIVKTGHKKGSVVGFDLAHGAGNLELKLHDWDVDFAVWCSYKYLNAGPGALAGCFVHERHAREKSLPRFSGWWGNNKQTRFKMERQFDAIAGAEGWQLSNPPIFQLAALRASMELFDQATMPALRKKGDLLTGYLEFLLDQIPNCEITTPRDVKQRGTQLSLRFKGDPKKLQRELVAQGVICDFREPDIIRAAPVPLYCSFEDVFLFSEILRKNGK